MSLLGILQQPHDVRLHVSEIKAAVAAIAALLKRKGTGIIFSAQHDLHIWDAAIQNQPGLYVDNWLHVSLAYSVPSLYTLYLAR